MGVTTMRIVRTGIGRPIQIIGFIVWFLAGLGALLWAWFVIFAVFGPLGLLVGIVAAPLTYVFSVLIVWFSTGTFPLDFLILWLVLQRRLVG